MTKAVRWTPQQLDAYDRRRLMVARPAQVQSVVTAALAGKQATEKRFKSKWEERFYEGTVVPALHAFAWSWCEYEALTLTLPGGVRYRPDFPVLRADGRMAMFEVKGRMMEPARIKLRQCVELYPFFEWFLVGGDMQPRRLLTPDDVPSTTRSKR